MGTSCSLCEPCRGRSRAIISTLCMKRLCCGQLDGWAPAVHGPGMASSRSCRVSGQTCQTCEHSSAQRERKVTDRPAGPAEPAPTGGVHCPRHVVHRQAVCWLFHSAAQHLQQQDIPWREMPAGTPLGAVQAWNLLKPSCFLSRAASFIWGITNAAGHLNKKKGAPGRLTTRRGGRGGRAAGGCLGGRPMRLHGPGLGSGLPGTAAQPETDRGQSGGCGKPSGLYALQA